MAIALARANHFAQEEVHKASIFPPKSARAVVIVNIQPSPNT